MYKSCTYFKISKYKNCVHGACTDNRTDIKISMYILCKEWTLKYLCMDYIRALKYYTFTDHVHNLKYLWSDLEIIIFVQDYVRILKYKCTEYVHTLKYLCTDYLQIMYRSRNINLCTDYVWILKYFSKVCVRTLKYLCTGYVRYIACT